jgi:hypothetical protein
MGRKEMEKESHSEFVKAARPGGPPAKRQPSPKGWVPIPFRLASPGDEGHGFSRAVAT